MAKTNPAWEARNKSVLAAAPNIESSFRIYGGAADAVQDVYDLAEGVSIKIAGYSRGRDVDMEAARRVTALFDALYTENGNLDDSYRSKVLVAHIVQLIFLLAMDRGGKFGDPGTMFNVYRKVFEDENDIDRSLRHIIRAVSTKKSDRRGAGLHDAVMKLPYLGGTLFTGDIAVPNYPASAAPLLDRVMEVNWLLVNPLVIGHIFEGTSGKLDRSATGMHFTSVPIIEHTYNTLFMRGVVATYNDALKKSTRAKIAAMKSLKATIASIRVIDPACGSGNFLAVGYKLLRLIEASINDVLGTPNDSTVVSLSHFGGIDINPMSVNLAVVSMHLMKMQADALTTPQAALLDGSSDTNDTPKILLGDSLADDVDWMGCANVDADSNVYIVGNPPYLGANRQSVEQRSAITRMFKGRTKGYKKFDYISGFFLKACETARGNPLDFAFVSTESVVGGVHSQNLWPVLKSAGFSVTTAFTPFKWDTASENPAQVKVVILALSNHFHGKRRLVTLLGGGNVQYEYVDEVPVSLTSDGGFVVTPKTKPPLGYTMTQRNRVSVNDPRVFDKSVFDRAVHDDPDVSRYIRSYYTGNMVLTNNHKYTLAIPKNEMTLAMHKHPFIRSVMDEYAAYAAQKRGCAVGEIKRETVTPPTSRLTLGIPMVSSPNRDYIPVRLFTDREVLYHTVVQTADAPMWFFSIMASRMNMAWAKLTATRSWAIYYNTTITCNTLPVAVLSENDKAVLEESGNRLWNVLREYTGNLADAYDCAKMPDDLKHALRDNDAAVEGVVFGRPAKDANDLREMLKASYKSLNPA